MHCMKLASKMFKFVILIGIVTIWLSFQVLTIESNQNTLVGNSPTDMSDFNWKSYIELNPDLAVAIKNEQDAIHHYQNHGVHEKRPYKVVPNPVSWSNTVHTVKRNIKKFDKSRIDLSKRNLIIYHIGAINYNNSMDVFVNNLKYFTSAISLHNAAVAKTPKALHHAVYVFNVVGGKDNPLLSLIPSAPNVAVIEWDRASSDMMTHIRTVHMFGESVTTQFSALIFLNQGVRGPMTLRNNAEWLTEYRRLLDNNGVAMVGSTISCESTPHVQTHIFAMQPVHFINTVKIIDSGPRASSWLGIIAQFEIGLSTTVIKNGYKVSAVLYDQRMKTPFFNDQCIQPASKANDLQNPTSWCDLTPQETIFMKWGGEPLRTNGYICDRTIEIMSRDLEKFAIAESAKGLIVPETLIGGRLYDLYKEYTQEMWVNRLDSVLRIEMPNGLGGVGKSLRAVTKNDKVCFLVRTYDTRPAFAESTFINYGLPELIYSLLKQTNPNWVATFFNTDLTDYDAELQRVLGAYKDNRLQYLSVPANKRPKFSTADAGYTATDHVLSLLSSRSECKWVSVTNGDNVYGSQVVDRVLGVQNVGYGPLNAPPDMILNPLDSRNFADQDYELRTELGDWSKRCLGIEAMLHFNRLAYCSQPIPAVGRVDLASLFLSKEKFLATGLYFSNFTDTHKYPCAGCQDGYFTEYLVRNRLWTYARLPIDGLKSMVFHGPSPTLCIASGNVWFDHPKVSKVGCYTHKTARKMLEDPAIQSHYDWTHHYERDRICLRFNKVGFDLALGKPSV